MDTELDLRVKADWAEMGRVNEEAGGFLAACGLGAEAVQMYTMVVCELVENAIKYGVFVDEEDRIEVHVTVSPVSVSVQVTHHCQVTGGPALGDLDRTVQWLRSYQAPFEAYVARMKAISREPLDADKSGLGLARITYEGRALLDFYVDENSRLSVSAVSSLV
ncbi:MAG TPA: ATP-binding protein [Spirochaetia bacterium]|nr:ATP-binding protein [Spirochaetia bacterium]